jgi:hypothetical protein
VHQRFNRYDDKSPNADVNVAYAWQSGHRPLQRANTYGLDGAFPTHLQPSLLRVYQWVSTRWHEFLIQPSKDSPLPSSPSASTADRLQHPSLPAAIGRVLEREKSMETRPTPSATPPGLDIAPTRKRKRFMGDIATCAVEAATASKARRGIETYSYEIRHSPQVAPVSRLLDDDTSLVTNDPDLGCTAASLSLSSQQQKQGSAATLHQTDPKGNIRAPEKGTSQGQQCTEEIGGNASTAAATGLLALLCSKAHRKATPEPVEPSTSAKLVRKHLAQQNENDQQLWLKGEHTHTLHRLLGQLRYWGGVPCPLCLTYEWHESVYDHELWQCRLREGSASARKMLRFLCAVQQPASREDSQCASCGYSRQICRYPQDIGFELERDCPCVEAVKKGIAVLLTVHNGMLGKTVYPQLVIANTHQKRADTRAWLEGEDEFWGIRVNRLLTVFHKLADGYDGLTGETHTREV